MADFSHLLGRNAIGLSASHHWASIKFIVAEANPSWATWHLRLYDHSKRTYRQQNAPKRANQQSDKLPLQLSLLDFTVTLLPSLPVDTNNAPMDT